MRPLLADRKGRPNSDLANKARDYQRGIDIEHPDALKRALLSVYAGIASTWRGVMQLCHQASYPSLPLRLGAPRLRLGAPEACDAAEFDGAVVGMPTGRTASRGLAAVMLLAGWFSDVF